MAEIDIRKFPTQQRYGSRTENCRESAVILFEVSLSGVSPKRGSKRRIAHDTRLPDRAAEYKPNKSSATASQLDSARSARVSKDRGISVGILLEDSRRMETRPLCKFAPDNSGLTPRRHFR